MPDASRQRLLTFDLGTTRLKVALFTRRGRLIGQRAARHIEHRHAGREWQDADQWWADAVRLGRELIARHPGPVAGIAVSGRGGAAVFIGRDGTVIGQPWSDRRHAAQVRALSAWSQSAVPLSNYATALLAKKQWFVANEPVRARQLRHVLYAKDFLLYRLTGRAITDPSSGPDATQWPDGVLAHTNSAALVPQVMLPWQTAGGLSDAAARALGLPAAVPVAVGAHDGICANVGAGAAFPGAYAITLGTHAVVRTVQRAPPPEAFRFYGLPPDRHVIGGNAVMAGRAADWFLDLVYGADDHSRARHFRGMDAAAAHIPAGADGVQFLPFLLGQVAPVSRPGASAVFTGLRTRHGRETMFRAVLEGGAYAVRGIYEQIHAWCGPPAVVRLTGSGAISPLWSGILTNVLNRELEVSDGAVEGRGAAIFAAVALGWYDDYEQAGAAMVPIRQRLMPDAAEAARYDALFGQWQRAAAATRPLDT